VEVFQDGSSHLHDPKDLGVFHAAFAAPCLTTFCGFDELGVVAIG
jgi:hypothetical protein